MTFAEFNEKINEIINSITSTGASILKENLIERIEKGIDVKDKAFLPLDSKTIRAKKRKGYDLRPVIATAKLKDSINCVAEENSIVVNVPVDYASYVNYGTSRQPQREFIGLPEETVKIIENNINEKLRSI
jgi:phage gpG-like protein